MLQAHAIRAALAITPMAQDEAKRALAMTQAAAFERSQLVGACANQNATRDQRAGQRERSRQHRCPLQQPLRDGSGHAESNPHGCVPEAEAQHYRRHRAGRPLRLRAGNEL
jgi:hypothetical protein